MSILTTLLPHKHVRFCDSIIAFAGYVRPFLSEPKTIDELWLEIDTAKNKWLGKPTFTHLIFAVDLLFALGSIQIYSTGHIGLKPTTNIQNEINQPILQ